MSFLQTIRRAALARAAGPAQEQLHVVRNLKLLEEPEDGLRLRTLDRCVISLIGAQVPRQSALRD